MQPQDKNWPAWFNGPNGETQIFNSEGEVPAGWTTGAEKRGADGSLHKAGLWPMKVGAARPDPMPGFPKPPLDL